MQQLDSGQIKSAGWKLFDQSRAHDWHELDRRKKVDRQRGIAIELVTSRSKGQKSSGGLKGS